MQKALTYLLVRLGDPSEPQASITQCDINSTTPLSYRLRFGGDFGKGVCIRVLQALAGNRNIRTNSIYIDVNDAMKRAAVELV